MDDLFKQLQNGKITREEYDERFHAKLQAAVDGEFDDFDVEAAMAKLDQLEENT